MPQKELAYRILTPDTGRVDRVVARLLDFSRARVRGLIEHGGVWINGEACDDPGTAVAVDDQLLIQYDPQRRYREKPPERSTHGFSVVYHDQQVVVVNKEAGLLTVPTDTGGEQRCLLELLTRHIHKGQPRRSKVCVVHRLDRDTSGLLVFGMQSLHAQILIKQFAARKPEREYVAIVAGIVADDRGEIRSLLHSDKALNQKSGAHGELAVTHYQVMQRCSDASVIRVRLETGRRNQIRVHFAEMGHPVLGDQRYATAEAKHKLWPHKRLALHAKILGFQHPTTGAALRFESELPREFTEFVRLAARVKI